MFIKKRGKAKAKAEAEKPHDGPAAGGPANIMQNEDDFDHRLGNYQLMEVRLKNSNCCMLTSPHNSLLLSFFHSVVFPSLLGKAVTVLYIAV
jgi:hypothetical protein